MRNTPSNFPFPVLNVHGHRSYVGPFGCPTSLLPLLPIDKPSLPFLVCMYNICNGQMTFYSYHYNNVELTVSRVQPTAYLYRANINKILGQQSRQQKDLFLNSRYINSRLLDPNQDASQEQPQVSCQHHGQPTTITSQVDLQPTPHVALRVLPLGHLPILRAGLILGLHPPRPRRHPGSGPDRAGPSGSWPHLNRNHLRPQVKHLFNHSLPSKQTVICPTCSDKTLQ